MTFSLKLEWQSAPGVRDPAEAATWCRTEIWADQVCLSELVDARNNTSRQGFYGSILPLVEWLIGVWPRLLHERRKPVEQSPDWSEWIGFHSFRSGRGGGAMPDIAVHRRNDRQIQITSRSDDQPPPGITVQFLRRVDTRASIEHVERELGRVVQAVLDQTEEQRESPRVEALHLRWKAARAPLARTAARLGIDDEELSGAETEMVRGIQEDPRADELLALGESSDALTLQERVQNARRLLALLPDTPQATPQWCRMEESASNTLYARPWLTGWAAAQQFRKLVRQSQDFVPGNKLGRLLEESCGWPEAAQTQPLGQAIDDQDTLYYKPENHLPVVVSRMKDQSLRFRVARSLYYCLFSPHVGSVVATDSPLLPSEFSESSAFAAELVAPIEWIRARAPGNQVWTEDYRNRLANQLHVNTKVVEHQIRNHHLGYMMRA